MANDFDDFPDDVFAAAPGASKGGSTANAFDSFDDDVFKSGKPADEFDHFDSPSQQDIKEFFPKASPAQQSARPGAFDGFDSDNDDEEAIKPSAPPPATGAAGKRPAPSSSSALPPPRSQPPPPRSQPPPPRRVAGRPLSENLDYQQAPPPPPPPPPPPSQSKHRPPPLPPSSDSDEDDSYQRSPVAPRPVPPPMPPPPPKAPFEVSKPKPAPPPPPPPPPPPSDDYLHGDEDESDDDDDGEGDFVPPPASPPPDEEEEEDVSPPPPQSPPSSDDEETYTSSPQPHWSAPPPPPPRESWDASELGEDEEFAPPPPESPPVEDESPAVTQYHHQQPEAIVVPDVAPSQQEQPQQKEAAMAVPPRRESAENVRSLPPRDEPIASTGRRLSFSDTVLQTAPAPLPPQQDYSSYPAVMVLPPPPAMESPVLPPPPPPPPSTMAPAVVLPQQQHNTRSSNTVVESVEDIDEKSEAETKAESVQSSLRKDSQESLTQMMRPPDHPPQQSIFKRRTSSQSSLEEMSPPPHPPPPPSSSSRQQSNGTLKRRESLSTAEEKQVALRLLRAVDTKTRTLNQRQIRYVRDLYEASDLDEDGKASFLELAAAVKMIDPELSVDQAFRFVQGLASHAGLKLGKDHFDRAEEFELSLSRATGVEVAVPDAEEEEKATTMMEMVEATTTAMHSSTPTTRSLEHYARWIDSLEIWPPISDLVEAFKSGVLLCKLVEHLLRQRDDARFRLRGVNPKPRSKAPCLQNLELALSIVWKQRVVARNMPTAERIHSGDVAAVQGLLKEVFTAFAVPSSHLKEMFEWFNGVLKHYDKELSASVLNPPHRGLWSAFGGGDALSCLLHFFCGPEGGSALNDGHVLPAVDLSRFYLNPVKVRQVRENVMELFELLNVCQVPVPFQVEDFVQAQDHEMLLVLLASIYVRFKDQACALPLVVPGGIVPTSSSNKQFVQVSQDGNVHVVGISFRDESLAKEEEESMAAVETMTKDEGGNQLTLARTLSGSSSIPNKQHSMKRTFTGYHSFSSQDNGENGIGGPLAEHHQHEDELVSSEIFFLSAPSLSAPPPPVLSEVMARSSSVSLERALAGGRNSQPAIDAFRRRSTDNTASHHNQSPGENLPPPMLSTLSTRPLRTEDPVTEIKSRLRERIHAAGAKVVLPSLAAEEENLRRAAEERRLFELEDRRRKAFLRLQKQQQHILPSNDRDSEQERVRTALSWLKSPRDVAIHNRNSVDHCRVFVSLAKKSDSGCRDYCIQWFDINDDSDAGSVMISDVFDVTTTTSEDGAIYVFVHLNRSSAVKTSKGRPSLKLQPKKVQEGLRFFANLSVLLEDVRNSRVRATSLDDDDLQSLQGQDEF